MLSERNLRRLARTLPRENPPATLRARVLGNLPEAVASPASSRHLLRLGIAGVMVASALLVLVLFPRSVLPPSRAQDIEAAVRQANTWHFVGWRRNNKGQQQKWEVWGRRQPFFYREQLGGQILLDDGKRRMHLLPQDPENGRTRPVCLILPTQATPGKSAPRSGDISARFLAGIGSDKPLFSPQQAWGKDRIFTATQAWMGYPYVEEITTLTVDADTHLPLRYVVRRVESQPEGKPGEGLDFSKRKPLRTYDKAVLLPTYDVPIPSEVAKMPTMQDYNIVDATVPFEGKVAGDTATLTRNGLTVRAEVVSQDGEGNLHLRFHSWLGNQPILFGYSGLMEDVGVASGYTQDNQKNPYVHIYGPRKPIPNKVQDNGIVDDWMVPLEPLQLGTPRPISIKLVVGFTVSQYERIGISGRTIPLLQETFNFELPLPNPTLDIGYDSAIGVKGRDYRGTRTTLPGQAAQSRAEYYMRIARDPLTFKGVDGETLSHRLTKKERCRRAAYWWEEASKEGARLGDKRMADGFHKNTELPRRWERELPKE
jgi:hypothetical protein